MGMKFSTVSDCGELSRNVALIRALSRAVRERGSAYVKNGNEVQRNERRWGSGGSVALIRALSRAVRERGSAYVKNGNEVQHRPTILATSRSFAFGK